MNFELGASKFERFEGKVEFYGFEGICEGTSKFIKIRFQIHFMAIGQCEVRHNRHKAIDTLMAIGTFI